MPERRAGGRVRRTWASEVAGTLLLAAVYVVAARAAFALGFVHTSIAPVWLPSGIALAAVLLFGRRAVLGVFLGAFLFNATTPVPLWVSAAIGVGNTLEAVAGAWLLRRAGFRREIDRVRDVLALAGLAALLATAISATVGVSSLWLSGTVSGGELRGAWAVWWLGDASGVLTVAPPLLLAGSAWGRRRRPALGRVLEAVALAATLVLVADAGLTGETTRPFVVFPALVWAAVRFRQAGAALASLFVSAVVVWLSAHGHGPYVASSPTERFLLGQTSTGAVMATSLVLAALTVQRELAARKLAERERQLAEARTQAELSRRLQNGLLPVLSLRDPTLLLRTRYQPGQERALLGADFYDAVELPDRTVATLIGDVAGHGPDEAAVGVALRAAWQGLVLSGHGPAGLLDGLDKVLVRNRPSEEMFTTVCCAWISPDRTQVTLALAGHPPPLLIRAGEVRVEEVPGGPALGIHDDGYAWEAKTLEVGHGWTLLCYTDGLVEGLQEPGSVERFGIDALVEAVSGLLAAGDDLDTVLDDLLVAVRRANGGDLSDDVAILCCSAISQLVHHAHPATGGRGATGHRQVPRAGRGQRGAALPAGQQAEDPGRPAAVVERIELRPDRSSPALARRFVHTFSDRQSLPPQIDDQLVLVGCELVTNAVLHAGTRLTLSLELHPDRVRVSVRDRSSTLPSLRRGQPDSLTGRGLGLVAAVSSGWGVDPSWAGKVVWAEIGLPVGRRSAATSRSGQRAAPWQTERIDTP
jgi:integral membrane sensor domain MASE1